MAVLSDKIICVFGGTGFVGRYIVQALARAGYRIKVVTRHAEKAYFLRTYGVVGQVVPFEADYTHEADLAEALRGAYAVVNCLGVLYETSKQKFNDIHNHVPELIARHAVKEGVQKFVHISALACERGQSRYAQTKHSGEEAVAREFSGAVILRPSVIFGSEDEFFNKFAGMTSFMPFLPLIGGGQTRFQPVYVEDVAQAAARAVIEDDMEGIYELAGPETMTFEEIYKRIFAYVGKSRPLLTAPWALAKMKAAFLGMLPHPLLTTDQVESLKTDNVTSGAEKTFTDIGISPTAVDLIVPAYLSRFRAGGRFGDKKKAAA
ncbi:MAG: NAD(P)H-binding protein [Alphaproteobacteria bacterium]|nr:NAD(P)H-binding protein [Alphaproteobacteria bacterium]